MLEKIGLPAKPSLRGNNWVVDASHCQGCSSQFTFINRKVRFFSVKSPPLQIPLFLIDFYFYEVFDRIEHHGTTLFESLFSNWISQITWKLLRIVLMNAVLFNSSSIIAVDVGACSVTAAPSREWSYVGREIPLFAYAIPARS